MTLKIGIVGSRGLSTVMGFNSIPGVKIEAICDLNEELLKEEAKKHNIPKTFRVYEDMLETDIDAVVISTPMQLHVPQAIAALEAGKHVMSEVTAGVTMDELWWLIEAVEKSEKVYMMAENYCYIPQVQIIDNMVQKGLFGDVFFGEGEYIHNVGDLLTYPNGKTSWRKYWQLGKRGCFYPTHSLGPVMKWFQGDRIKSISCYGTGWNSRPDLRQEDTSLTLCQMESGKLIKIRLDCVSNRPHNLSYYSLQGTKGCYEAPRGLGDDHKIWFEDMPQDEGTCKFKPLSDFYEYLPDRYKCATDEQKNAGHWGGDFFIVKDFIDAIMNGTKPEIDVYEACEWTAVGLLSELSVSNRARSIDIPDFRKSKKYSEQIVRI